MYLSAALSASPCSTDRHILSCGHFLLSNGPTPCGSNCSAPQSGKQQGLYEFACRTCRSDTDLKLVRAVQRLGGFISLHDPLNSSQGQAEYNQDELITLHGRELSNGDLRRLQDRMIAVKVWIAYRPPRKLSIPKVTHAIILETIWQRYLAEDRVGISIQEHLTKKEAESRLRYQRRSVEAARRKFGKIQNQTEGMVSGPSLFQEQTETVPSPCQRLSSRENESRLRKLPPLFTDADTKQTKSNSQETQVGEVWSSNISETRLQPVSTHRKRRVMRIRHKDGTLTKIPLEDYQRSLTLIGKEETKKVFKQKKHNLKRIHGRQDLYITNGNEQHLRKSVSRPEEEIGLSEEAENSWSEGKTKCQENIRDPPSPVIEAGEESLETLWTAVVRLAHGSKDLTVPSPSFPPPRGF